MKDIHPALGQVIFNAAQVAAEGTAQLRVPQGNVGHLSGVAVVPLEQMAVTHHPDPQPGGAVEIDNIAALRMGLAH